MENNDFVVSVSPHIYGKRNTTGIMFEVIIALIPAAIASLIIFGMRSALVIGVCVAACVGFEAIFDLICKKPMTVGDLSAVVTGLLLALNLPADIPVYISIVGSFVAIIVAKCLFGGLGFNFANPAITARVVMLMAFTENMTSVVAPKAKENIDLIAGATPLPLLYGEESAPAFMESTSLLDMFLGIRGGALGETSAIALLLGGIYLVVRGIITWHTPVVFIGTVFLGSLAITGDMMSALYFTLSGGVFIGAIFMATDYVTTPCTPLGKVVFGLGCGLITLLIRFYGSFPEGVSFSILLMNILTPYIEKYTMLKPLGGVKE